MNGKIARELRKALKYHPRNKREYQTLELPTEKYIAQFSVDDDGKINSNLVKRTVPSYLIECVSGDRKLYKALKSKYYNVHYEQEFNRLPKQGELNDLINTIKDDFRAPTGGGLPGKNESDQRETNQERRPETDSELPSN